jgi:cytochrome P450
MSHDEFFSPEVLENPYAFYRRLRGVSPVLEAADGHGNNVFLVLSYEAVREVLHRPDDLSSRLGNLLVGGAGDNPEAMAIMRRCVRHVPTMIDNDDPGHRRYRALANRVFTPARLGKMSDYLNRIIDALIDGFIARGECDFIGEFAAPLPIYVIADFMGVDRRLHARFRQWTDAFLVFLSKMASKDEEVAAARLVLEFSDFLLERIESRRSAPGDDLISDLIAVREEGVDPLTDPEIHSIMRAIAVAGAEAIRNALIEGLTILIQDGGQRRALLDDPALAAAAVEELLRFSSPTAGMWRIAARATSLAGAPIPAGARVLLRFDSANRDPARFADPDRFDIRRSNAREHLSFGFGVHFCLGAMVSRRQLAAALPRVLARLEGVRIVADKSDLGFRPSVIHHTMRALHLAFDPVEPTRSVGS